MEEILIVLIQGLIEFGIEFLIWFGVDLSWSRDDGWFGVGRVVVFLGIGLLLGVAANSIHPRLFMPNEALRIGGLVVGPLAAGVIGWILANRRAKRSKRDLIPMNHAASAFCFVLGFDAARFAYGAH